MEPKVYIIRHRSNPMGTPDIARSWGLRCQWHRIDPQETITFIGRVLTGAIVLTGPPPKTDNYELPELPLPLSNEQAKEVATYWFGPYHYENTSAALKAEQERLKWMAQREERIKDERTALVAKLLKVNRRLEKMKDSS